MISYSVLWQIQKLTATYLTRSKFSACVFHLVVRFRMITIQCYLKMDTKNTTKSKSKGRERNKIKWKQTKNKLMAATVVTNSEEGEWKNIMLCEKSGWKNSDGKSFKEHVVCCSDFLILGKFPWQEINYRLYRSS